MRLSNGGVSMRGNSVSMQLGLDLTTWSFLDGDDYFCPRSS